MIAKNYSFDSGTTIKWEKRIRKFLKENERFKPCHQEERHRYQLWSKEVARRDLIFDRATNIVFLVLLKGGRQKGSHILDLVKGGRHKGSHISDLVKGNRQMGFQSDRATIIVFWFWLKEVARRDLIFRFWLKEVARRDLIFQLLVKGNRQTGFLVDWAIIIGFWFWLKEVARRDLIFQLW